MSRLLILGAGGHGKVVAEIANKMGIWETIAFLDDRDELDQVIGIPVIGKLKEFESLRNQFRYAFVAIGNNQARLKWLKSLMNAGFNLPALIDPFSAVSKHSRIGDGTVVMAGVVINAGASIGKGCIINTCSSIDHDSILEEGVHISPGVHIAGTVHIGCYSWLCVGSNVSNNITIGSKTIVAAGATVINDIPDNVLVAGVPAIIKKRLGDE